jgi:hypothetical protein
MVLFKGLNLIIALASLATSGIGKQWLLRDEQSMALTSFLQRHLWLVIGY